METDAKKRTTTQTARLLTALKQHPMTTLEVINRLGIIRPASTVNILRGMGYSIETEMIDVRNRWNEKCNVAKYRLCVLSPARHRASNDAAFGRGMQLCYCVVGPAVAPGAMVGVAGHYRGFPNAKVDDNQLEIKL